jgi:hypothetical protein|tara:strand:+ start:238 stop:459 length:222 start_codon:yes stop_codon:yes gene_type:complete
MASKSIETTSSQNARTIFEYGNRDRLEKIKNIKVKKAKKMSSAQRRRHILSKKKISPYTITYSIRRKSIRRKK